HHLHPHGAERIAGPAAGVSDGGVGGGAAEAVAEGDVAVPVDGEAPHPAVSAIGGEGALLVELPAAAGVTELIPADAGVTDPGDVVYVGVDFHPVVGHERLVVPQVSVVEAVHQPVGEGVHSGRGQAEEVVAGLGDAVR